MESFTVELPKIPDRTVSIVDFGAVSGGRVSNTGAINRAVRAAAAQGGGRVVIPRGIWLTGPITLESNIDLHVEAGAVLRFDKTKEEYPLYLSDYEGMEAVRARSPIQAEHASHIAITGRGVIDGGGEAWRPTKQCKVTQKQWKDMLEQSPYVIQGKEGGIWMPTETIYKGWNLAKQNSDILKSPEQAAEYYDYFRPVMVYLFECDHVLIEDITLQNSPAWNVHPLFCSHITIRNAVIRNPYYAQNGDGLDLESCRYAHIHDTVFDVGDDGICLKSGKGAKARETRRPTEYVNIHDCIVYHGHGGFVVGSEMSRGVRHVEVKDCSFLGTDVGIRFKSALGRGGVVEDIAISSIQMLNIEKEAIIFTMGYVLDDEKSPDAKQFSEEDIPYFKNIRMEKITCSGAETGLKVEGLAQAAQPTIDEIYLKDSVIAAKTPQEIRNAGNIVLENVQMVKG